MSPSEELGTLPDLMRAGRALGGQWPKAQQTTCDQNGWKWLDIVGSGWQWLEMIGVAGNEEKKKQNLRMNDNSSAFNTIRKKRPSDHYEYYCNQVFNEKKCLWIERTTTFAFVVDVRNDSISVSYCEREILPMHCSMIKQSSLINLSKLWIPKSTIPHPSWTLAVKVLQQSCCPIFSLI